MQRAALKKIVLSAECFLDSEEELVRNLFAQGFGRFHLRKPGASAQQLKAFLEQFSENERRKIVLHSFRELVKAYGLAGYHIRSALLSSDPPEGLSLSASCHNKQELLQAEKLGVAYAFLSPIFPSISKPGYGPDYEKEELKALVQETSFPVFALGGVDEEKLSLIEEFGFAGAVFHGSLWSRKLQEFAHV